jgi:hypothetical protein
MYSPLNNPSAAVQQVTQQLTAAQAAFGPDGLVLATPDKSLFNDIDIPERLQDKLLDIRLLKAIPLSYMVPDAALLPPESIRFFYVDQTWVDRVIDGTLSAANAGSVDVAFSCGLNQLIRQNLDAQMGKRADQAVSDASDSKITVSGWSPDTHPMTGMLIRSDIVRRWPQMSVRAYTTAQSTSAPIGVLRAEAISTGIYIALFAGVPGLVQVGEPHVGVRFGVEALDPTKPEAGAYKVDLRDATGKEVVNVKVPIPLRAPAAQRVLQVSAFAASTVASINANHQGPASATGRVVAIELARQPWVQDFVNAAGITEADGIHSSCDANGKPVKVTLANGRTLSSISRLAAQQTRKP